MFAGAAGGAGMHGMHAGMNAGMGAAGMPGTMHGAAAGGGPDSKGQYWKTRICHKWQNSCCNLVAEACRYAHGDADLRQPGAVVGVDVDVDVALHCGICGYGCGEA